MSTQKNLITLCFATVFTLGLAACGGGGDAPVADMMDNGDNGDTDDTMTSPSVADLFATAVTTMGAAEDAGTAAADALKAATDNKAEFDTMAVRGESSVAEMNAQAILDAKDDVDEALANAMMALQDATTAKEHADALADDAANKAALIEALKDAIVEAGAQIKSIGMIRDGMALADAVAAVTGDDEDEPMSAADHGQMVAMAIGGALGPTSPTDGSGLRAPDLVLASAENAVDVVEIDDHTGKTWAEIVGDDSLVDMRIAEGVTGTHRAVKAMSFADMALTTIDDGDQATAGSASDGAQFGGTYKGIDGVVFCAGTDCKVTDGKLAGSWYFTTGSGNAKTYYEKAVGATQYMPEVNYALFGHWLTVNGNAATVHTFASSIADSGAADGLDVTTVNTTPEETTLRDTSATYEGTAAGMSLHKEVDGDGAAVEGTLQSGAFTADVTLTAKFGTAPTLGGYINGFEGNAVDPDWRVTLVEGGFVDATLADDSTTTASGQDGEWTATGYGVAGERPTGIFGGFNAHFTDGHAAGAYATRK